MTSYLVAEVIIGSNEGANVGFDKLHYDDKYFDWQAFIGEFAGWTNGSINAD